MQMNKSRFDLITYLPDQDVRCYQHSTQASKGLVKDLLLVNAGYEAAAAPKTKHKHWSCRPD